MRVLKGLGILALAGGSIYVLAGLVRSPYGSEVLYITGEIGDLYWDPNPVRLAGGRPGSTGRGPEFVQERTGAPGIEFIRNEVAPVADRGGNDLSRAVAIRKWVREEIDYGTSLTDRDAADLAADDILREGRQGIRSPCNRLVALYVTACLAVGIPARMVHLMTPEGPGHFVAEAWLADRRCWVMMDPSADYYATVAGVPASVLDLHRAVERDERGTIEFHRDGATSFPPPDGRPFNRRYELVDYFHSFSVVYRNDFLSRRSKDDDVALVEWKDGAGPARVSPSEILRFGAKLGCAVLAAAAALAWGLAPLVWRRPALWNPPEERGRNS